MKIFLLLISLLISGCATTVSDYQQGCRDGIKTWVMQTQKAYIQESILEIGCANVETHFRPKKEREPHGRHR